jgi:putative transposase
LLRRRKCHPDAPKSSPASSTLNRRWRYCPNGTSTSGPTAFTWTRRNACSSYIGATLEGKKELVGFTDGERQSAQSWCALLLDRKRRGLFVAPEVAVVDGAVGFRKALGQVWPTTREQRCWAHKTANVLNKLPKSLHAKAKRALQQIWISETKKDALVAFDVFVDAYGAEYEKAAKCPTRDS